MKKLAGMAGLVAVGYTAFAITGDSRQQSIDAAILVYITAVYTLGVLVMLIYTRQWSVIGCGLLATMTGDALLYGRLSQHMPFMPGGPWALDLARSCFIVGGTYLLAGLVLWMRAQDGDTAMLTDTTPEEV